MKWKTIWLFFCRDEIFRVFKGYFEIFLALQKVNIFFAMYRKYFVKHTDVVKRENYQVFQWTHLRQIPQFGRQRQQADDGQAWVFHQPDQEDLPPEGVNHWGSVGINRRGGVKEIKKKNLLTTEFLFPLCTKLNLSECVICTKPNLFSRVHFLPFFLPILFAFWTWLVHIVSMYRRSKIKSRQRKAKSLFFLLQRRRSRRDNWSSCIQKKCVSEHVFQYMC